MAVYAIGDVQGCYDELMRLLEHLTFDPSRDQIWLAGDLVNRGPRSADVLRFAISMGDSVKAVLGNHDLHLLAKGFGVTERHHHLDTLSDVLSAPDSEILLDWLRHLPLIYRDSSLNFTMIHAGLPPQWTVKQARHFAEEVHQVLQSDRAPLFLEKMYGNGPDQWSSALTGWDRLRYITNCFTRLRYCHQDGRLALKFKGHPSKKPADQFPWFEMPQRKSAKDRIVFGHWSTLGTGRYHQVFSLDSGVVWGEQLTALRLDQKPLKWFAIEAGAR